MKGAIIADRIFDKQDFVQVPLPKGEYEYCVFTGCELGNADLTNIFFLECRFEGCNLSMANLERATLRDVQFKECKMLGMRFDSCNQFGFAIHIDHCSLNHSSFYKTKLKKTIFINASFHEADFTECNLSSSVFNNCDFAGATFDNTILEKADFRSSIHYSIDPQRNRIKKARFSLTGVIGLLDKYDIVIEGL
jgi:fluoroquinolone resistance protein